MAAPRTYRLVISPTSSGNHGGSGTIIKGVASSKRLDAQHDTTITASEAQILGVMNYIGLIKASSNTSTVETAITALTP